MDLIRPTLALSVGLWLTNPLICYLIIQQSPPIPHARRSLHQKLSSEVREIIYIVSKSES